MPDDVFSALCFMPTCNFMQREDERFEYLKAEVPWGSVRLAIGLMLFGLSAFVVAWLHITQEILGKEQAVSPCMLYLVTCIILLPESGLSSCWTHW